MTQAKPRTTRFSAFDDKERAVLAIALTSAVLMAAAAEEEGAERVRHVQLVMDATVLMNELIAEYGEEIDPELLELLQGVIDTRKGSNGAVS